MVYQGSKNRIAKFLKPIIESTMEANGFDVYVEPCVGGANLIDKISAKKKIGCDINHKLIALFKAIQKDPTISFAPEEVSREFYNELRQNRDCEKYPPELIALVGFCASFQGRGIDGGFGKAKNGREKYPEALRNLKRQAYKIQDIEFRACDYKDFPYDDYRALYYFDPPYKGTTGYDYTKFDNDEFVEFLRTLAQKEDMLFLVSEYDMPDDFVQVWEGKVGVYKDSKRIKNTTTTERLFTHKSMLNRIVVPQDNQLKLQF